jgi:putative transposase
MFLSDVPALALQQALKNLERAYTNFFQKRADFPKFKKKSQRNGFRIPQGGLLVPVLPQNMSPRAPFPKAGAVRYRKRTVTRERNSSASGADSPPMQTGLVL